MALLLRKRIATTVVKPSYIPDMYTGRRSKPSNTTTKPRSTHTTPKLCSAVQLPPAQGVAFHYLCRPRLNRRCCDRGILDMDTQIKVCCVRHPKLGSCRISSGILHRIDRDPGYLQSQLSRGRSALHSSQWDQPSVESTLQCVLRQPRLPNRGHAFPGKPPRAPDCARRAGSTGDTQ